MEYFYIGMIAIFLAGIVVIAKTMDGEDMQS